MHAPSNFPTGAAGFLTGAQRRKNLWKKYWNSPGIGYVSWPLLTRMKITRSDWGSCSEGARKILLYGLYLWF